MFDKNEFMKYATKHLGMSGMHLEKYASATSRIAAPNIHAFTPAIKPPFAKAYAAFGNGGYA